MASLNFPSSPAIGDIYVSGNSQWQWNGKVWLALTAPGGPSYLYTSDIGTSVQAYSATLAGITGTKVANWDAAYGWGNHASAGYVSGATTLGESLVHATNPNAVTFIRVNADNTVSTLSATDFRTAIGAGTGSGGSITVADEGTTLTSAATSLNFTGAGVTATNTAGAVTVDIAGGGGGTSPSFSARPTSNLSMTAGEFLLVTLGTEEWDTNNNFASSRFTPTVAGKYMLAGLLVTTSTGGGMFTVTVYKNGIIHKTLGRHEGRDSNSTMLANGSCIVDMNGTTDYVELYVFCSVAHTISAGSSYFQGHKLP